VTPGSGPGLFGRFALAVLRQPRRTLLAVLVLTLLSALAATRLSVQPNILDLLPDNDPTTLAIRRVNDEEGGTAVLTIAVSGGEDDTRKAFARGLAQDLEQVHGVRWVLYEVDPDLAVHLGMLQLTPTELGEIRTKLQSALALGAAAQNPIVASRLLALGPLTARLNDPSSVQVLSGEDGTERILVRPEGSAFDPKFARPFMAEVYATIDKADPAAHGVQIAWVGGAYRHAVEDLEAIIHDLTATISVSFCLVLAFLAIGFRRPRAVALIMAPLLIGNIWTLGYAGLLVPRLNTFTSYFTAVLIGLGVDFGIHLYSRYREERPKAATAEEAIVRTWDAAGPPCMTAAVTSAAGFLALWVAGFQGFQQLGTLLAGGVMLCLFAELLVLPLLLVRFEPDAIARPAPAVIHAAPSPRYRRAPWALAAGVLVALLAATQLPRIQFEYDISELRSKGMSYADLDEEQRALARDSYSPVVVSYADDGELSADDATIRAAIAAGDAPQIKGAISIYSLLPRDQAARVEQLQQIAALARDDGIRFLPPPVRANLARIRGAEPRLLTAADLPESIAQLVGASEGHHRMMLMADGNMWDIRSMVKLKATINRLLPGRVAAGEYLATALLFDLMRVDAPRIALLAMVLVFLASWLDLRNFGRALAAIGGLAAGMSLAGAGMVLTGTKLSMANFVGIPILMGIGIDVVIHLLHRIREEGPGGVWRALRTTGWAAIMSAATTLISFASLALADSRGVQGLGKLIVLGLSMVVVAAFVLVPLGWMTAWRNKQV